MTPGARVQAAAELLDAIASEAETGGLPGDRVVQGFFRARRYAGSKDRAAVSGMVYAVLRHRAQIDWWLARFGLPASSRGRVLAALRACCGWRVAQIDGVSGSDRHAIAALDEGEREALHGMPRNGLDHVAQPDWVRANVPEWLAPEFRAGVGSGWVDECAALAMEGTVDLRANTLLGDREAARLVLADDGIAAAPTPCAPQGLRLPARGDIRRSRAYKAGLVEIQDEASQLVALLLEARPDDAVCDYCAGGGGKTLALAAAMDNRGRIAACDTVPGRLDAMLPRLERAGVEIVERHLLSGGSPTGPFDRVLVDAPCSGTGAWRRNPDARWRLTPGDLDGLVALQRDILDRAARLVGPGGRLVYATCSLLDRENRAQVEAFLDRCPDFALVPAEQVLSRLGLETTFAAGPYFLATPARHATDGFFAAILQRTG